jgi:hypothetical protein
VGHRHVLDVADLLQIGQDAGQLVRRHPHHEVGGALVVTGRRLLVALVDPSADGLHQLADPLGTLGRVLDDEGGGGGRHHLPVGVGVVGHAPGLPRSDGPGTGRTVAGTVLRAARVRAGAGAADEQRQDQRHDHRAEGAPHGRDGRPVILSPTSADAQS